MEFCDFDSNVIQIIPNSILEIKKIHGIFRCDVIHKAATSNEPASEQVITMAIKSLQKSEKKNIEYFRREYELLATFSDTSNKTAHPRIVSVFGYLESYPEYGPLFLMELGERSLYDLLQNTKIDTGDGPGKYSFGHCLNYLTQIAEALQYLHEEITFGKEKKPIIHRDLKSCNILLFNEGRDCKLCDFGVSKKEEETMTAGVGTPGWRAPELIEKSKRADGKLMYTTTADCFSFGSVCIEALFREIPAKIGRLDDVPHPEESKEERESKVNFFSEVRKVLYLSNSTFYENKAFKSKMSEIMGLLNGLFELYPSKRLKAIEVLQSLRGLQEQTCRNLPSLYGPNADLRPVSDDREINQPKIPSIEPSSNEVIASRTSDSTSVFLTLEKPETTRDKFFTDREKKRIKEVMQIMVPNLNTLAKGSDSACSADFQICLTEDEPASLRLEIKVRQSSTDEISVADWCRNNEKECVEEFNRFFINDPIIHPVFKMRYPNLYTPDVDINDQFGQMSV